MTWRGNITPINRLWSSLLYLLPLVGVLPLGTSEYGLFQTIPALGLVLSPLFRLIPLHSGIPGIAIFLLLFFLVVRNTRIAHAVRFNAIQALLLDIATFLATVVIGLFGDIFSGLNLGMILGTLSTTVLLAVLGAVGYAVVQTILGRYSQIPVLSDAAYTYVRD